ncbi:hypothetical protein JT06_07930 [Desulfobulbus sp. Tol-SR]|nr:hypothetical protein JT06_07930 [Desulfobulbus sp. Tol-SR]
MPPGGGPTAVFLAPYFITGSVKQLPGKVMSSSHQNRLTFIDVARTYAILLALLSHVFAATGFFQQLGSDALLIRQFTRMATPLFMFMFGFMNEYFAPWNIVTCFIHRGKCDSDAGRREGRFHESVRFCDPVFRGDSLYYTKY